MKYFNSNSTPEIDKIADGKPNNHFHQQKPITRLEIQKTVTSLDLNWSDLRSARMDQVGITGASINYESEIESPHSE